MNEQPIQMLERSIDHPGKLSATEVEVIASCLARRMMMLRLDDRRAENEEGGER